MEGEKDRFGELMRLLERAKEDIYFAARDRELIEQLKARLATFNKPGHEEARLRCPKCPGFLESYTFKDFPLQRCRSCGGVWFDKGEIEAIAGIPARHPWSFPTTWVP